MKSVVYHGSPTGDIKEIKAHISTHGKKCIYATDNKVVAMLFMGSGMGDLDTVLAISDELPILVERRSGVLKNNYNQPGYIYELDGSSFRHHKYLWKAEVISFKESIEPIKCDYYENILDTLIDEEKKGNLKIYHYPNRPDNIPVDNSDLVDKYIRAYKNGNKKAIYNLLKYYPEFENQVLKKLGWESVNDEEF